MKADNELIQIFREEARELLEEINSHYKKWSQAPFDKELISPILRDIHTLKGSARMVGLSAINQYIHALELIFQGIYQQEITPGSEVIQTLQYAIDYLNYYIDDYKDFAFPDDNKIPIADLRKYSHASKDTPPPEDQKESSKDDLSKQVKVDYIRVKSDQLEKFSALAAQINIARSHIDQTLKRAFSGMTDSFKQVKIVQEQLKFLQMKADANISSYSSLVAAEGNEEFDVLELDRYSFFQQATRDLSERVNYIGLLTEHSVNLIKNVDINLVEQKRSVRTLEEGITHSRLISMDRLVPRLERVVRQVSHELSKDVQLICVKVEGEIDKKALERLLPAFEHMVRNAIDHGIELPDVRRAKGKPAYGVIKLSLFKQGNEIVIQLADDGIGVEVEKIKKKAVEKNLWESSIPMSQADAFRLIFLPGFSTKDIVTPISGQGVGLDVVNAEVNKLGGVLRIDSQPEVGTQFTIRIPFTLSLNQSLIFMIGSQYYAFPLSHLVALKRYPLPVLEECLNSGKPLEYGNQCYRLIYLGKLLGKGEWNTKYHNQKDFSVIFLKSEGCYTAILVDKLLGSWEIVIKPVGTQLQFIPEIAGVSLFNEQKIVLILDAPTLIHQAWRNQKAMMRHTLYLHQPKILIVDDSITVRQVTARFLKRHQYESVGVRDGIEALSYMAENIPDVVLLDLEMPEMDGFEVLEKMRSNPKLRDIPVVIITSRSGEKHQARALKLGVSGYFTKPYLEEHLLALLKEILSE
jgi:chemosensory pili system protein ChpA (sensor histidine kinase/response regulator)